jgi:hypothetical protein
MAYFTVPGEFNYSSFSNIKYYQELKLSACPSNTPHREKTGDQSRDCRP